jgi:hypothetical protein
MVFNNFIKESGNLIIIWKNKRHKEYQNILYLALPQIQGGCNGIHRPKNGLKIPPTVNGFKRFCMVFNNFIKESGKLIKI